MPKLPPLSEVLRRLRRHYGAPAAPVSGDPFELILREQVAYLANDEQRRKAWDALHAQIGLKPADILAATPAMLTRIARMGGAIAADVRAARMRKSAQIVTDKWHGNLARVFALPLPQARRALGAFPMIGEPGADKLLATLSNARLLPLDSNGLRVVQRLALARELPDYRRAYRNAQEALTEQVPRTRAGRAVAYALLREHGQTLCRRSAPRCAQCPLLELCVSGKARLDGARGRAAGL